MFLLRNCEKKEQSTSLKLCLYSQSVISRALNAVTARTSKNVGQDCAISVLIVAWKVCTQADQVTNVLGSNRPFLFSVLSILLIWERTSLNEIV